MPNTQIEITKGSYYRDIEFLSRVDYRVKGRTEICFSRPGIVGVWSNPWVCFFTENNYGGKKISLEDASVLVALFHLLCL